MLQAGIKMRGNSPVMSHGAKKGQRDGGRMGDVKGGGTKAVTGWGGQLYKASGDIVHMVYTLYP